MPPLDDFLDAPGRGGLFGALLDESARAADDFCRLVERFSQSAFDEQRPSDDPSTVSPRAICAHVCGAQRRYADYIRKALGLPHVDRYELPLDAVRFPRDVRPLLGDALRYTEGAVAGIVDDKRDPQDIATFAVRWGPVYDPEMILEHGVVHLLRHRRQLERWREGLSRAPRS